MPYLQIQLHVKSYVAPLVAKYVICDIMFVHRILYSTCVPKMVVDLPINSDK